MHSSSPKVPHSCSIHIECTNTYQHLPALARFMKRDDSKVQHICNTRKPHLAHPFGPQGFLTPLPLVTAPITVQPAPPAWLHETWDRIGFPLGIALQC